MNRGRASGLATPLLLAIFVSVLGALAAAAFSWGVLEGSPHLEDEIAYLFQARVFAAGRLIAPVTDHRCAFWQPFVVEVAGQRFGKYPPGWPALLALGVLVDRPWLVNPLLGGITLYLVYRLGREVYGARVGLLAAGLGATSPLYLTLSGSLMAHAASAAFFLVFCLAFLRLRCTGRMAWGVTAGLALGAVLLIRPFTAVGLGLPFLLYGLVQGVREKWSVFRRWLPLALSTLAVAALLLLFNWVVAGGPLVNPYLLVFPFDRLGFGSAVGPGGHDALDALVNLGSAAVLLSRDLLGWLWLSWSGVVVALLLPVRSWRDWALAAPFVGLLLAHTLYWYGGLIPYGSRYQYEGVPLLWLLTAVGVEKLDRRLSRRGRRATAAVLTVLVLSNLVVVLPARIEALHGLYGVSRGWFAPVEEANLHQSLVLCVGEHWRDCGPMYGRMDPFAQGEVVYARSCSPGEDAALMAAMPGRTVYRFDGETLELVRLREQAP